MTTILVASVVVEGLVIAFMYAILRRQAAMIDTLHDEVLKSVVAKWRGEVEDA